MRKVLFATGLGVMAAFAAGSAFANAELNKMLLKPEVKTALAKVGVEPRGTNSEDRHSGTTALVRQLLRGKTTSVIATHDTQLARTEAERSAAAVDNYHFDGKVTGTELSFDYRLKAGICESLNATALMKKIGIQIDE